ncbi:hypothetical protein ACH4TQ_41420 [Streptomyces sp. NPDC021218]|uniref:hypothetical protein n=1 Tax=Streptomyces sp. NPDC021218 TaxID=3365119 RepID=UPI0037A1BB4F
MINTHPDTPDETIPEFPMPRAAGCPFAPPPELLRLHATRPLSRVRLWDGSTPWLVTRYDDQRALYSDQRLSVDPTRPGFPHMSAAFQEALSKNPPSFLHMDDPGHARIRRMVTGPFIVKRIEAMRPAVQRMTDDFIDTMLAGPNPADLVAALALPLPSLVICELLGVPYEDHAFFQSKSAVGVRRDASPEETRAAGGALLAYLDEQLQAKLADPADDLLPVSW